MTFDEYQKRAKETARYPKVGRGFVYPTIGLIGEVGEMANKVKKVFRDDGGILEGPRREEIAKELGDVLWYLSQTATELDLSLDEVAKANLEKLASRFSRNAIAGEGDDR